MRSRKAMSQTLALIVAASVLMMTALTVIFLTQGSLTEIGTSSTEQSCLGTVKSKCGLPGQTRINAPNACLDDQDNPIDALSSSEYTYENGEIECPASNP